MENAKDTPVQELPAGAWDMPLTEVLARYYPKADKQEADKQLYSCGCGGCVTCGVENHPDTLNF